MMECTGYWLRPSESVIDNKNVLNIEFSSVECFKASLYGITLCEVAVLLARQFPSTLSSDVLSVLTSRPELADDVHVTPVFITGWAFSVVGGLIRVWCHQTLGKFFTWEMSIQDNHKLLTTGPYAIVRHPSYLGLTLLAIGNILTVHGPGSWLMECGFMGGVADKALKVMIPAYWSMIVMMLWGRMNREDAILEEQFGHEWRAWARRTPYQIVPFVW